MLTSFCWKVFIALKARKATAHYLEGLEAFLNPLAALQATVLTELDKSPDITEPVRLLISSSSWIQTSTNTANLTSYGIRNYTNNY
jgi:hypothetical protein